MVMMESAARGLPAVLPQTISDRLMDMAAVHPFKIASRVRTIETIEPLPFRFPFRSNEPTKEHERRPT